MLLVDRHPEVSRCLPGAASSLLACSTYTTVGGITVCLFSCVLNPHECRDRSPSLGIGSGFPPTFCFPCGVVGVPS